MNEYCVAVPPGHNDVNDCPPNPHKSCSVPIPPAAYHLCVEQESISIRSNAIPFTVLDPPPSAVSLLLLYPAYYVQLGDFVTLRGKGFTPTGNTVHVGSVLIPNLASASDSIRFPVPDAAVPHSSPTFPVFVSNANGVSNALTLAFRARPNRIATWPNGTDLAGHQYRPGTGLAWFRVRIPDKISDSTSLRRVRWTHHGREPDPDARDQSYWTERARPTVFVAKRPRKDGVQSILYASIC